MKSLFAAIRETFSKSPSVPFEDLQPPLGDDITPEAKEKRDKEIVRRVVSSLSSGNVFLQQGKYVTKDDLDKRREHILAYQWNDE